MTYKNIDNIKRLIDEGLCIGCGICAYQAPEFFSMRFTREGVWKAEISMVSETFYSESMKSVQCPMTGDSFDEDSISTKLFPNLQRYPGLGVYKNLYAGHVSAGDYREKGSSGGMISWLADRLLLSGQVSCVVHVRRNETQSDGAIFEYQLSRTSEDLLSGAKSKYYPTTLDSILNVVKGYPNDRFVFIAIPCFVKAVRLLQFQKPSLFVQIPMLIGIVCGHMKSAHFTNYLALQKEIEPSNLRDVDFREKIQGEPASVYGISFKYVNNKKLQKSPVYTMREMEGRDWGEGLFRHPACEYCDDVVAECADISVGDAWLPNYLHDSLGSNLVIVRNESLSKLISAEIELQTLSLKEISCQQAYSSQASGIRHRTEGLAHRLAIRHFSGLFTPLKRVAPKLADSRIRRHLYDLREKLSRQSIDIFSNIEQPNQLEQFEQKIRPLRKKYQRIQTLEKLITKSPNEVAKALFRYIQRRIQKRP